MEKTVTIFTSLQSFSHVLLVTSDSRTTLTASLALAFTVELSLLSVDGQEIRGHGWYMQRQSPACTASILLSCREDKRKTHASYKR